MGLILKRNRGWPARSGERELFGADGFCEACWVPYHEQTGRLVLERPRARMTGVWVPNWIFDTLCVDEALAEEVASGFDVDLRPIEWARGGAERAFQIVIPTVGDMWFDPDGLAQRAVEVHGSAGATCPVCGVWRWMPLTLRRDLPLVLEPGTLHGDIAASPEWFGDVRKSFRLFLVRRELAELLAARSPRDFWVHEAPGAP